MRASRTWQGKQQDPNYGLAGFNNGGGFLALHLRQQEQTMLELVSLSWLGPVQSWNVPLLPRADQAVTVQFAPYGDYTLASVSNSSAGIPQQTIFAAHFGPGGGLENPVLLATAISPKEDLPTVAPALSELMLTYINSKGELHAATYDHKLDTIIADKVGGVWCLGKRSDLTSTP